MTGMPERKAPLSRALGVPEGLGPDHPLRQTVRRYRRPDWVFGGASSAGKFTPMQMRKDQMNPTKTTFSSRLLPPPRHSLPGVAGDCQPAGSGARPCPSEVLDPGG